jgi:microcin C transport system substrate-binding protein
MGARLSAIGSCGGLVAAAALLSGIPALADPTAETRHHALSLIAPPKYAADFEHFDWVNPDAPKGGTVRFAAQGTFDSLNPFSIKGTPATGLGMIYDSLMAQSPEEESTEYGLVAEWVFFPADYSSATFGLRSGARFHDGEPIKPEDVIFSLEALKKAHPHYGRYYKNVVKAEKTGEREVTFTFDKAGNRELPHILGQLSVLPKHYWEGTGANGEPRDLSKSTLEVPLGSGPYKIKDVKTASRIVYERVEDYWAKELPVVRGQWNFGELRFQYFRDRVAAFEEFKSGKADFWRENTASAWATQFGFEAVKKGWVKKEVLPTAGVARMQAFVLNTRRKQFQDPRVRRAFNLAFNFEDMNEKVLFGQYKRVGSFFDNSELKATGLPTGRELEILNEYKADLPAEVFTAEWKNPVNGTREEMRSNLATAMKLLKDAGWEMRQEAQDDPDCGFFCKLFGSAKTANVMQNAEGETLSAEFLLGSPSFQRHVAHYSANLEKIGIQASVRVVDSAQYEQRETNFDFDIIVDGFPQSLSPGNEQRDFWGSAAAGHPGSRNTIGIKSPVIDGLIEKIVFAKERDELVAATRALDRVLLWNHYVVPQWYNANEWLATWDIFGRPERLPSQTSAFTQIWWIDESKQKALAAARGS